MRIAFCAIKNIARGGGIEKYTLELGSRLARKGHDVVVYSMGHYGDVAPEFEGMKIVKVPCLPYARTEKLSAGLAGALRTIIDPKADVVHYHSVAAGAFALLSRVRSQKCVLQMHGVEWERQRWGSFGQNVLKGLERLSVGQAQQMTAVSKKQCRFFKERYGVEMRYIPTGADIKEPTPAKEILEWGLKPWQYVLFASRLVREKGAQYLIPAFRKLETDFKLVIAGDAKGEEALKEELQELAGGDPRILFPGFVEGRALEELFSNSACYAQPSELEGLSIALLEGMSYGSCCLVSDIEENMEPIQDTGVSFRNADIDDMSEKLKYVLDNPGLTEELGSKARERVRNHYSWDHIADEFEAMYTELLEA